MVVHAEYMSDFKHCTLIGTLARIGLQFKRNQNHEGSGIEDTERTKTFS